MIVYLFSATLVLTGLVVLLGTLLHHQRDANAELRSENARLRDTIGRDRRRRGTP